VRRPKRDDGDDFEIRPEFLAQLPIMATMIYCDDVSAGDAVQQAIHILEEIEMELGE
jgi:hypothetical protein